MLDVPVGQKIVSYEALIRRADGTVEDLGLIDHSHAWLYTTDELAKLCKGIRSYGERNFENMVALAKSGLHGATVIPTGSSTIEGGKGLFASQIGGGTSTPPQYIGFGQGDPAGTRITAQTTNLGLAGEIAAPGGTNTNTGQSARVTGTVSYVTTTNNVDTMQVVGTITAGTALQITEAGLFTTSAFPAQFTVATIAGTFLNGSTTGGGTATISSASGVPTATTNYQMVSTGGTVLEVFSASLSGTTLTAVARGLNGTSAAAARAAGVLITAVSATGTGATGLCAAVGDFALISLASADTLQLTAKVQAT